MTLLLLMLGLAQAKTHNVQDLGSSMPMLSSLMSVAFGLEGEGYQITDMNLGIALEDRDGVQRMLLGQGSTVDVTLVGDPERMAHVSFVVLDPNGDQVAVSHKYRDFDFGADDQGNPEPVPQVQRTTVTAKSPGYYRIKVDMEEGAEDWGIGYYSTVVSHESASPISVDETLLTVMLSTLFAETEGMKVQAAGWTTLSEDVRSEVVVNLDSGTFSECAAFATSSESRSKKLTMDILEPGGALQDSGKKGARDAVAGVTFVPFAAGDWRVGMTVTKMKRKITDTHGAFVLGCWE